MISKKGWEGKKEGMEIKKGIPRRRAITRGILERKRKKKKKKRKEKEESVDEGT